MGGIGTVPVLVALAIAWSPAAWAGAGAPGSSPNERPRPPAAGLPGAKVVAARSDVFLVTPRWSPDGEILLASGRFGVGLYRVPLNDAEELEAIDPTARVEVSFAPDGRTVALHFPAGDDDFVEYDLETRNKTKTSRPSYAPRLHAPDPASTSRVKGGRVLQDDGQRRIVYERKLGEVSLLQARREDVLIARQAWRVALSPDGRWLAYVTGSIEQPELRVSDLSGSDRLIGPGAYPSWFPDSSRLVYSVPEAAGTTDQGVLDHSAADLFVYDLTSGTSHVMAITPDVVEMEPAVSPRGDWLAFADWRSGTIQIAPTDGAAEPGEGGDE